MKKYFFLCLLLISFEKLCAMDDDITNKFIEVQMQTHPLRRQLNIIKRYFAYKKPSLTAEQHEKFKWFHHTISTSLDRVLMQCDLAHIDRCSSKFLQLDEYLKKAHAHLKQANKELADYKLALKDISGIDLDTRAGL